MASNRNEDKPRPSGPIWEAAKVERNWLVWASVAGPDGKKPRKVPTLWGKATSPEDAAQYTFSEARMLQAEGLGLRLGYLPREGSALIGVDLDRVIDEEGYIDEAFEVYLTAETYTEVSPSGRGLRLLVGRDGWPSINIDDGKTHVGVLATAQRYFSVSLDHLDEEPTEVTPAPRLREAVLAALEARLQAEAERAQAEAATAGQAGWFDGLDREAQAEVAAAILDALPQEWRDERDLWRDATFALRAYPHLIDVWDAWSRGGVGYDQAQNVALWDERERGAHRITIGSLIHHATQGGLDLGPWRQRGSVQASSERMAELRARIERRPGGAEAIAEVEAQAEEEAGEAAELEAEAHESLVLHLKSITTQTARWFDLQTPSTLSDRKEDLFPTAGLEGRYGRQLMTRLRNTGRVTSEWPIRDPREAYGFVQTGWHGQQPLGVINRYRHREVNPEASLDLSHPGMQMWVEVMERIFPVERERVWAEQWIAHKARFPWVRMVALVNTTVVSGTGRGMLGSLMRRLFRVENVASLKASDFTQDGGRFNEYMDAVLAIMDELSTDAAMTERTNHKALGKAIYEVLKDCVDPGEKFVPLNSKYGAKRDIQSFTSFLLFTNHEDALPIPAGDRRFMITKGNDEPAPIGFSEMVARLRDDEEAMDVIWRHLVERVDLTGFNPYEVVDTDARQDMIDAQVSDLDRELADVLERAGWPLFMTMDLLKMAANLTEAGVEKRKHGGLDAALKNWMQNHTTPMAQPEGSDQRGARVIKIGGKATRVRVMKESLKRHGTTLRAVTHTAPHEMSEAVEATATHLRDGTRNGLRVVE